MKTAFDRSAALAEMGDRQFDTVIVGGGITGAGVALDAASRGLRTALIERHDFASGTSSKSSKLIHGGLRYLQQREVRLVYEALAERQNLLRNAPHLVSELPFLLPMFHRNGLIPKKLERALGGAMWGYDLTGGLRIGKRHQRLDAAETLDLMPSLDPDRVGGGYLYYDAAADDARLTLSLVRTAAIDHGAVVANRVAAVGLEKSDGEKIIAVRAETAEGDELRIRTSSVVNATGVWADSVRRFDTGRTEDTLRPAKGIHLTFPAEPFGNKVAAIVPVPKDRRSIFVIPWGEQVYVGTTDTDYDGPIDEPHCTPEDVAYVVGALQASTTAQVDASAVTGTWAGLRPLVKAASSDRTADLSRRHSVATTSSGMVTVTGGKLTTYRRMAADAVDAVVERLDLPPALRGCRTKRLTLIGAEGDAGTSTEHLRGRYGSEAAVIDAIVAADPGLATPLVLGLPYLKAEAIFAARWEMATTLDDVLSRRTRARLRDLNATVRAAPEVADLLAAELGWSSTTTAANLSAFLTSTRDEASAWQIA